MAKIHFNLFATYLSFIKKSSGSKMFQSAYAVSKHRSFDITKHGRLSCAIYVSGLLRIFGLIREGHATVSSTVKDMKQSGWRRIALPKPGAVLVWEAKKFKDGLHRHIGFYFGNGRAISNSNTARVPAVHHWTYKNKRKIEEILWHSKLD